jgi:hypothetical protein
MFLRFGRASVGRRSSAAVAVTISFLVAGPDG